jgi:hypothetical protein
MDLMDEHGGPIVSGGPAAVKRSVETRRIRGCLKVLLLDHLARADGPPDQKLQGRGRCGLRITGRRAQTIGRRLLGAHMKLRV